MPRLARLLAPGLALILLSACASRPRAEDPEALRARAQPPDDFTVAVTVFAPAPREGHDTPRWALPARYIVEADRVLRAAVGPGAEVDAFPPRTRTLNDAQFRALWRELQESPLLDAPPSAEYGAGRPAPDALDLPNPSYILSWSAAGRRHTLLIDGTSPDSGAASTRRLTDLLADFAWLE